MPAVPVDFANAIKGKRTLDSMRDAVATELARAKIAANEVADRISFNLRTIDAHPDHAFLFNDRASIVLKHPDDLHLLVKVRMDEHQAKEAAQAKALPIAVAAIEAAQAPEMVQVMGLTVPKEMLESTPFYKQHMAPSAPTISPDRAELNALLDLLTDAEIQRVSSFVKSRYPQEVAA